MSESQKLFALLIDGDNAQATLIPEILDKVSQYGKPSIRKIYGDWSKDQLLSWGPVARKYHIEIAHHYNVSSGKNATDIALVIDAMDILHQQRDKLFGFCIVSSDSDFTHLARRIRREGLFVLGIGKPNSEPYTEAYDEFIPTERLQSGNASTADTPDPQPTVAEMPEDNFLELLIEAYHQAAAKDEQGRVMLRDLRDVIKELHPEFSQEYDRMPKFVNRVKLVAEAYTDIITLVEDNSNKPILHYLHIKFTNGATTGSELDRFRSAYQHVADVLKLKDDEGWVLLSTIGDRLHSQYPEDDPLIYRDIKHKQLKKVVEKMMVDYPGIIELNPENQHPRIRLKK